MAELTKKQIVILSDTFERLKKLRNCMDKTARYPLTYDAILTKMLDDEDKLCNTK